MVQSVHTSPFILVTYKYFPFTARLGRPSLNTTCKLLILKWWPGMESNRRRQPLQGCALPRVQTDWWSPAFLQIPIVLRLRRVPFACEQERLASEPAYSPKLLIQRILNLLTRIGNEKRAWLRELFWSDSSCDADALFVILLLSA
jgi:hypothetical protein